MTGSEGDKKVPSDVKELNVEERIPCRKGTTFGGRQPEEEIVEEIDFLSIYKLARDADDSPPLLVEMSLNGENVTLRGGQWRGGYYNAKE